MIAFFTDHLLFSIADFACACVMRTRNNVVHYIIPN